MITGGLMIVIVSFVFDGTPLPMIATIAICAFGSFVVIHATLGLNKMPVQDAAHKKCRRRLSPARMRNRVNCGLLDAPLSHPPNLRSPP